MFFTTIIKLTSGVKSIIAAIYSTGGSPGFGRGGGARIIFQSDMLRMAKPCALLGGFAPEKIFLNGAIWCVLVYILIKLYL